jgi:hypothetical protein
MTEILDRWIAEEWARQQAAGELLRRVADNLDEPDADGFITIRINTREAP